MSVYYSAGPAAAAFLLAGCLQAATLINTGAHQETSDTQEPEVIRYREETDETYDDADAIHITLLEDHAELDENESEAGGVELKEGVITIHAPGTYVLTGKLDNGTVVVDVDANETVRLVLNSASLSSDSGAALNIKQADTVIVTVPTSTKNRIEGSGESENQSCGGITGTGNLVINGGGSLEINSDSGSGILYEGNVSLANTMAAVHSQASGIAAYNVEVSDCILSITSGSNAIETQAGDAKIQGGVLNLVAKCHGIRTTGDMISSGSEIRITANENDIDCQGTIVTLPKDDGPDSPDNR